MQPTDHWLEVRWQVSKPHADVFLSQLDQMGALGSFEDLDLDAKREAEKTSCLIISYFPDSKSPQTLEKSLRSVENTDIKLLQLARIPYGNWATEWKKYFHPFALTPEIVICPSWEQYTPKSHEHVITLDPGMAFGTGQHDTTRFCADFLCDLKKQGVALANVLDVGCGSGILSFIAKKLGATRVFGIDVDDAAVETSNENLERNPDLSDISFAKTDGSLADVVNGSFDVIVANIIAEALCELKPKLVSFMTNKGFLIISGILPERAALIKEHFSDLRCIAEKTSDNWHAYLYQK